jgi:hypothetical protein
MSFLSDFIIKRIKLSSIESFVANADVCDRIA